MKFRLTKVRLQYSNDPVEDVREDVSRRSAWKWIHRHREADNTIELFVQDEDGDLVYFYRRKPLLEEIYHKDGTLTKHLKEMGK